MMLKIQFYITEIHYILNYIKKWKQLFYVISQFYYFYFIVNQINAALLNLRDFFQKYYTIWPPLNQIWIMSMNRFEQ